MSRMALLKAGSTGPGAAFAPSDITGLSLWLKSDTGVTVDGSSNVSQWNDQSGNGNNFTQATAAQRPALSSAQLNGYPGVSFDGTDDSLSIANVLGIANQSARTLFMVAKTRAAATRQIFFYQGVAAGGTSYWNTGLGGNGFYSFLASDVGVTSGSSNTSYHDFVASFSAMTTGTDVPTASTFYIDGADAKTNTFAGNFATMAGADTTVLGRYPSGTAFYANYILIELCIWNNEVTAGNRSSLRSYAQTKYAY